MKSLLYFPLFLILYSCNDYQSELEAEQAKVKIINDNISFLEEEQKLINGDYEIAITTINEINESINLIAKNNKLIDEILLTQSSELSMGHQVIEKLQLLRDANKKAEKNVQHLKSKARQYKVLNVELKKMIDNLELKYQQDSMQLDTLNSYIGILQSSLQKMEQSLDSADSEMSNAYALLKVSTSRLELSNKNLKETLRELQERNQFIGDDATGYVVCGSKKELRTTKILKLLSNKTLTKDYTENVLKNGSTINYFNDDIIECSDGNADYVLPFRPSDSYRIEGNKVIITNKDIFWETSKIVVIIKK